MEELLNNDEIKAKLAQFRKNAVDKNSRTYKFRELRNRLNEIKNVIANPYNHHTTARDIDPRRELHKWHEDMEALSPTAKDLIKDNFVGNLLTDYNATKRHLELHSQFGSSTLYHGVAHPSLALYRSAEERYNSLNERPKEEKQLSVFTLIKQDLIKYFKNLFKK